MSFDSDDDGDVNLFDLASFVACMTDPGEVATADCQTTHDEDGDEDVDLDDFQGFQVAFTAPGIPTAT